MRNLVIYNIITFSELYPDLPYELDFEVERLEEMSNKELLQLLIECVEIINE